MRARPEMTATVFARESVPGRLARLAAGVGLLAAIVLAGCREQPERPPIILITLDTTRADHLHCYGYGRETTPNLDRFCQDAVLYQNCYSVSSWTLPSHASLFTGKFPTSHGARYSPTGAFDLNQAIEFDHPVKRLASGLSPEESTLAEILREHGYTTAGVVGGPWLKKVFGLGRGFDFYDDSNITSVAGRRAEDVTDVALDWLEGHRQEPFFLFLNYFDPHGPYSPPDGFHRAFLTDKLTLESGKKAELLKAAYDAEILYTDHHLGRLFEELKQWGLYDPAWIIVTGDHGELMGEHGLFGHSKSLSQPEIHVPLIIKRPHNHYGNQQRETPVQVVDVFPMLIETLGLSPPAGIQGSPPDSVRHPIVAEFYPFPDQSPQGAWQVLIKDDLKLVWTSNGRRRLYDLKSDPGETRNLVRHQKKTADRMQAALHGYLTSLPKPGATGPAEELDAETLEALRELGYLDK